MQQRKSFILKIISFVLIGIVFGWLLGEFIRPVWVKWNNYSTVYGFYEEPEDTIETLFLGSSTVINGINTMQLYEEYGLCGYNMATEQQPVFASYYWLKEVHGLHSDSLKTVVLDTSMFRRRGEDAFYLKGLDGIRTLSNRFEAFYDYTDDLNEAISYTVPLFSWHSRWSELGKEDFIKQNYTPASYTRGYKLSTDNIILDVEDGKYYLPANYQEETAEVVELNEMAVEYCEKIVAFCQENDLELIFIQTPRGTGWNRSLHNAVALLSEELGIEFIDFNYAPYVEEINYVSLVDLVDEDHLNYYGAKKLTSYIGKHLVENYGATDVRDAEKYAFMEEQLVTYNSKVLPKVQLSACKDPADYIAEAMKNEAYSVFITVKDEASAALTEEQRTQFKELGLQGLAELEYRAPYIAVIDCGEVVYESSKEASGESAQPLTYEGTLKSGISYKLESGGKETGNISVCTVDGENRAKDKRGINIVVWDNESESLLASVRFDTYKSSEREVVTESALVEEMQTLDQSKWSKTVQKYAEYLQKCQDLSSPAN